MGAEVVDGDGRSEVGGIVVAEAARGRHGQ
jgi:hypothetical protein